MGTLDSKRLTVLQIPAERITRYGLHGCARDIFKEIETYYALPQDPFASHG